MRKLDTPLIGITLRSVSTAASEQKYPPPWNQYARAVADTGGLPVLIPTNLDFETIERLLSKLDAVILSGGGDLDPSCYQEPVVEPVRQLDPPRDQVEISMARWIVEHQMPVLGICRGLQIMNVALGGSLYQNLAREHAGAIDHDQAENYKTVVHPVSLEPESLLGKLVGSSEIETNSCHHQAIKTMAPSLRIAGRTADGLVEAIEHPHHTFALGVQWHPEYLLDRPESQAIFKALSERARGGDLS